MALRHAVLAALLDGEHSGYELTKIFDISVSNFWHAVPQQIYAELTRLERAGLIEGRQVIQHDRPNKRLFTITEAGLAELQDFADAASKPSFIRDDLLVKVQAVDGLDPAPVIAQLDERAAQARGRIELFTRILVRLRGPLDEEEFLARGERVGPYLTCLRGLRFEHENRDWCTGTAALLRARTRESQGT
ncbi:PadR family transcriptional regulator [Spirillospora sp. CA-294931]|uniref:PadR family transcriptional regulator n=1 Tax=Spirillospora sp. CA-294931 TaxID=3240042 RepID=UPI003D8F70AC